MANDLVPAEKHAADFLKGLGGALESYAIRDYSQTAFLKSAMIAIAMNEDLQKCLASREGKMSMVNALRMAAGTGLSLNPQEGKAALIPYSKKVNNNWIKTAQYQVMKNGLVELALASDKVEFIMSETVHENDQFTLRKTMGGDAYDFAPARKNRGAPDGFFAAVKMKDGTTHCRYMDIDEVEEHRDKYAKGLLDDNGKPKEGHTWNKSFRGMAEKTVLKRLLRNLHINTAIDQAVGADGWEPEPVFAPPPKGASASDVAESLKADAETAEDAELADPAPADTSPAASEGQTGGAETPPDGDNPGQADEPGQAIGPNEPPF